MKSLKNMSVNAKLTALIMAVAFFALILGFAVITALDARNFRQELIEDSILNARITAEYCVGDLAFGYEDEASQALKKLSILKSFRHAAIYDIRGNIFANYAREGEKFARKTMKPMASLKKTYAEFLNGNLEVYEPMTYKGEPYGILHICISTAQLAEKIWSRVKLVVILAFCVAIIVFFLTTRVQRLISQPILQLAELTRNIAHNQDYSLRTGMKRNDEIGILSEGFNSMLKNLQERSLERDAATAQLIKARNELEDNVMERTAELRMTNKELEAFTYSASHDLRGPLRRIDGFTSLLEQEYENVLDDNGKEYIKKARFSCHHMTEIIDNLLKLSRVVRQEMDCKTVNMTALAKDIVKHLQESEPTRKINIIIAEGIKAKGDQGLLMESLGNLLENAWKFTNKTKNPKIEFGILKKENQDVYFVKDNGCGFEMKYMNKIFKPFQRLHTLTEFPGTGIGLSTVQRVIERHKGQVWANGELNKGTTLSFTLWTECKKAPLTF